MPLTYKERIQKFFPKTIYFDREEDADCIEWLQKQYNASESVRQAVRDRIVKETNGPGQAVAIDEEAIRQVLDEALSQQLADVRRIVDSALAGLVVAGGPALEQGQEDEEKADLLASLDASLDIEE